MLAAAALKCMGGEIQGRLYPRDDEERAAALEAGYDLDAVLTTDDLVQGDNCFFAATGITDGELLQGVQFHEFGATTQSLVMRSKSGTLRKIDANHALAKLSEFSSDLVRLSGRRSGSPAAHSAARGHAQPAARPVPAPLQPRDQRASVGASSPARRLGRRTASRAELGHPLRRRLAGLLGPRHVDLGRASSATPASTVTRVESPGSGPSPSARPSAAPGLVSTWTNPRAPRGATCVPSACSTLTCPGTTSPTSGVWPSSTVSAPSEVASTTDGGTAGHQRLLGRDDLHAEDVVGH